MQQNLTSYKLHIAGMTCNGCEMRIENALRALKGVVEARADYISSILEVIFDPEVVSLPMIINTLETLGYKVDQKDSPVKNDISQDLSVDKFSFKQVLGIGIIIFALYFLINNTVGFNFIPQIDQSMSYGILFVIGLLTSIHCIGMCGGINISQCITIPHRSVIAANGLSRLKPGLLYNLGRVISYTVIGGIAGSLGSVIGFSGEVKGIVAVIAGIFMIIMGTNMLNIFPWLKKLAPRFPKRFGTRIYSNNSRTPLLVGLLNGLMPCGPLQTMQLYALASSSLWTGAISMLAFSLGTVPLMFGLGAISSLLSARFTKGLMNASALLVIFLGVIMLGRGMSLGGYNPLAFVSETSSVKSGSIAKLEEDFQTVATILDSGRYSPIIVQKDIPVKWIITAEADDLNGCNNPVTIPKYDIETTLKPGDNLIEFTPDEEGNITYTCWMGMISSYIKVVPDLNAISDNDLKELNAEGSSSSAGCCSNNTSTPAQSRPSLGCCIR